MSDTYIGWDGKSYPWPPPDGWYHASDGRWWAPGTGPNPPQATATSGFEATSAFQATSAFEATSSFEAGATIVAGHTAELDHTSQYPDAGRYTGPDPGHLPPPTPRSQPSSYFDDHPHHDSDPGGHLPPPAGPSFGAGPAAGADFGPAHDDDPYGYGAPPVAAAPDGEGLGPKKLVIAVAAVLAVVAIGVSAFVILGRGDDTAIDANGTTTTLPGTPVTSVGIPIDPAATSVPVATVVPDPGAATTLAPVDPGAATTLTPENAALVASFRALLVQNGLTSDKLNDTEIQTFAASFCVFAKNSKNTDDFNVFRQQAIAETQSSLDPASLSKVIDAAVITFCPEEAARLGVTLG